MGLRKSEAILLKHQKLGDSSRIVTLYIRQQGKLKLVAKGARRPKSRLASALELFNHVSVIYYYKENRDLHTLSQIDLIHPFVHLRQDLNKIAYASAVAELTDHLVVGEESNPELFTLLLDLLQELNKQPPEASESLFWAFQLRLAALFGYRPQFDRCVRCGKLVRQPRPVFMPAFGGILCPSCSPNRKSPDVYLLALGSARLLQKLQDIPLSLVSRYKVSAPSRAEIGPLLQAFLAYHTDDHRALKSLKVLASLNQSFPTP